MFDKEKWSEVIEALSAKPFRTLITAFGVLWGIFILVILLSAGKGLENGVRKSFDGVAMNSLFIMGANTTMAYQGFPTGRKVRLKNSDLEILKNQLPKLKYISPSNGASGSTMRGTKKGSYPINGYYPNFVNQLPYEVVSGRFINYNDIENKTKIVIIGKSVVNELFDVNEDPLGNYIQINGVGFLVVGTYHSNSTFGNAESEQQKIFMPYTTCQQVFNLGEDVGQLMLTAQDDVPATDIKNEVLKTLKANHHVHPDDERAFFIFDLYEQYKKTTDLFLILKIVVCYLSC